MAEILWTGWQHSHGLRGNIPVDWVAEIRGIRTHHAGIRSIWLNRGQEPCPDARLSTELSAFEPLENALKALHVT